MGLWRILIRVVALAAAVVLLALSVWVGIRTWPRHIQFPAESLPPVQFESDRWIVPFPAEVLVAEVGRFDNELSAYLWFDYLRTKPWAASFEVLLFVREAGKTPMYQIQIVLPNDALTAIPLGVQLKAQRAVPEFELIFSSRRQVEYSRRQTKIFEAAYNRPVSQKLEDLGGKQLLARTARFLAFKSRTDPRVQGADGFPIAGLSRQEATELAADIIAVAKFYDLPLDVFLGIGAMENNYLNIRGDINHSVWKKKPAKDDVILKRRRHRVLVSDYSIGLWQITRETLRYAHTLYVQDKRDYSQLPERLVPPKDLELDVTNTHILTTYAGLLLRNLLDRFDGNIEKAVGAYNGGPRNPNLQYATGVQTVAEYARNVLERLTALNRQAAQTELRLRAAPTQRHIVP
jgi:hypothetical protein